MANDHDYESDIDDALLLQADEGITYSPGLADPPFPPPSSGTGYRYRWQWQIQGVGAPLPLLAGSKKFLY